MRPDLGVPLKPSEDIVIVEGRPIGVSLPKPSPPPPPREEPAEKPVSEFEGSIAYKLAQVGEQYYKRAEEKLESKKPLTRVVGAGEQTVGELIYIGAGFISAPESYRELVDVPGSVYSLATGKQYNPLQPNVPEFVGGTISSGVRSAQERELVSTKELDFVMRNREYLLGNIAGEILTGLGVGTAVKYGLKGLGITRAAKVKPVKPVSEITQADIIGKAVKSKPDTSLETTLKQFPLKEDPLAPPGSVVRVLMPRKAPAPPPTTPTELYKYPISLKKAELREVFLAKPTIVSRPSPVRPVKPFSKQLAFYPKITREDIALVLGREYAYRKPYTPLSKTFIEPKAPPAGRGQVLEPPLLKPKKAPIPTKEEIKEATEFKTPGERKYYKPPLDEEIEELIYTVPRGLGISRGVKPYEIARPSYVYKPPIDKPVSIARLTPQAAQFEKQLTGFTHPTILKTTQAQKALYAPRVSEVSTAKITPRAGPTYKPMMRGLTVGRPITVGRGFTPKAPARAPPLAPPYKRHERQREPLKRKRRFMGFAWGDFFDPVRLEISKKQLRELGFTD